VRLLFVSGPAREAIILAAGDEAGERGRWCGEAIPLAGDRDAACGREREGGVVKAVRWEDTRRRVRELDPGWDSAGRVAARGRSREELRAEQRGYQMAQLRRNSRLTQAQVAAAMGISQARVSQIEHCRVTELDAVRAYIEALGGTVDVLARVGGWTVKVA
jgi:predicted XRE-type DNA-binding protein